MAKVLYPVVPEVERFGLVWPLGGMYVHPSTLEAAGYQLVRLSASRDGGTLSSDGTVRGASWAVGSKRLSFSWDDKNRFVVDGILFSSDMEWAWVQVGSAGSQNPNYGLFQLQSEQPTGELGVRILAAKK